MNKYIFNHDICRVTESSSQNITEIECVNTNLENEEVFISVVDVEILKIPVLMEKGIDVRVRVESEFERKMGRDYLVQFEEIKENVYQAFGIKKEKIAQIYSVVGKNASLTIKPYGVNVRTFVKEKISEPKQKIIYIEKLEKEIFLTHLNGCEVFKTRRITYFNEESLIFEIKRSLSEYEYKKDFEIITNDNQILKTLKESKLASNKALHYFDVISAGFSAFGKDTILNYKHPKEIELLEKTKKRKDCVNVVLIVSVIIMSGLLPLTMSLVMTKKLINKQNIYIVENLKTIAELKNQITKKYRTIIHGNEFYYSDVYLDVVSSLPVGSSIESIVIERKEKNIRMEFRVVMQNTQLQYFDIPKYKNVIEQREEDVLIKNMPGKKIILNIQG